MLRTVKLAQTRIPLTETALGSYFYSKHNRLRNVAQAIDGMLTHNVVGEVGEATS
jgi:hypothetical protein